MIVSSTLYVIIEHIPKPRRTTGIAQAFHEIMGVLNRLERRGGKSPDSFRHCQYDLGDAPPSKDLSVSHGVTINRTSQCTGIRAGGRRINSPKAH
jgi:hypothetical protein